MTTRRRPAPTALASLAIVLPLLAACTASPSGPCGHAAITLEAEVDAERMTPSALEACRDQEVTLELTSEIGGEFHIHGIEGEAEAELTAGATATVEFTTSVAGQFIIEVHPAEGEEFEAGVLTVLEP